MEKFLCFITNDGAKLFDEILSIDLNINVGTAKYKNKYEPIDSYKCPLSGDKFIDFTPTKEYGFYLVKKENIVYKTDETCLETKNGVWGKDSFEKKWKEEKLIKMLDDDFLEEELKKLLRE